MDRVINEDVILLKEDDLKPTRNLKLKFDKTKVKNLENMDDKNDGRGGRKEKLFGPKMREKMIFFEEKRNTTHRRKPRKKKK